MRYSKNKRLFSPQTKETDKVCWEESQLEHSEVKTIMDQVYTALEEKGYRPIDQLTGYFLENNLTYITNHNDARALMKQMDRRDLLHELLSRYFSHKT